MPPPTNKLKLTGQSAKFAAVQAQFAKWRSLLAERKEVYDRLPREAQSAWRESEADPVLADSWAMLQELAAWFDVEVPE